MQPQQQWVLRRQTGVFASMCMVTMPLPSREVDNVVTFCDFRAVELDKVPVCDDGVCASAERRLAGRADTAETCTADCPFVAHECPCPGSLAVSDPYKVLRFLLCLFLCLCFAHARALCEVRPCFDVAQSAWASLP